MSISPTRQKNSRDTHIDIMKAIAILCVIIGHLQFVPLWANRLIMSFHMPLFFILSGKFFKNEKYSIKVDFKRLVVPYLFTGILIILIECIIDPSLWKHTIKDVLYQMMLSSGSRHHDCLPDGLIPSIRVLWFLMALFFARYFYHLVLKFFHSEWAQTIITLLLSIIGMIVDNHLVYTPLAINQALLVLFFLQLGRLSNNYALKYWNIAILLAFWIYPALFYTVDLCRAHLDGLLYPITVLGTVGGVLIISYISKLLSKCERIGRIMAGIGQITLPIMCYHAIIHHGKFFYQYNPVITTILWIGIPLTLAIFSYRIPLINKVFNTTNSIFTTCKK